MCEVCGQPIPPRDRHSYAQRAATRYCSRDCMSRRAHATYDELRELIALGESPRIAAQRVGVSAAAAARWFYRHGHDDLARAFQRIQKAERSRT